MSQIWLCDCDVSFHNDNSLNLGSNSITLLPIPASSISPASSSTLLDAPPMISSKKKKECLLFHTPEYTYTSNLMRVSKMMNLLYSDICILLGFECLLGADL